MKKVILVFVPGAAPNCIPLGIASLFAYAQNALPDIAISMVDLSILFWNRLAVGDKIGRDETEALYQTADAFFNKTLYLEKRHKMAALMTRWQQITHSLMTRLSGDKQEMDPWYTATLFEKLEVTDTDIVALSAAYPEQLFHAAVIARLLKSRYPNLTVVLGGSALPSIHPSTFMAAVPQLDGLYLGEGEQGLVDYILGQSHESRGWMVRERGQITSGRRPLAIPMQNLPAPSFHDLHISTRWMPTPVLPVAFSRGCKWRKCAFCCHNFGFAGYRTNDYARFATHLEQLQQQYHAAYFYFTDQYIDANALHGIATEILKRKLQIRFHVMGRPTSDYTREVLELLFEAGCRWISWGVESGAQSLLDGCQKGTQVAAVARVLKHSHLAGINNLAMMVFGLPGTNDALFQETLDFATDVSPWVDAFTDSSFQLFEGTPYYNRAQAMGIFPGENEILFKVGNVAVVSNRLAYRYTSQNGEPVLPPGPGEVALWQRWKAWIRGESFFETLSAEHYLLIADHLSKAPLLN
ncbi:MAG: radical SAM protein [Deltaproteobacteria bacterium]|nr:radical SAM protein [Deltaproteobacteria bacterium]